MEAQVWIQNEKLSRDAGKTIKCCRGGAWELIKLSLYFIEWERASTCDWLHIHASFFLFCFSLMLTGLAALSLHVSRIIFKCQLFSQNAKEAGARREALILNTFLMFSLAFERCNLQALRGSDMHKQLAPQCWARLAALRPPSWWVYCSVPVCGWCRVDWLWWQLCC